MDLYHVMLSLVMLIVLVESKTSKSYYDILGVKKTDSTNTIKKAFRQLAMKYHPDKNPDKKNAEAQFREIVEGILIAFWLNYSTWIILRIRF